jgi:hypothetical protein
MCCYIFTVRRPGYALHGYVAVTRNQILKGICFKLITSNNCQDMTILLLLLSRCWSTFPSRKLSRSSVHLCSTKNHHSILLDLDFAATPVSTIHLILWKKILGMLSSSIAGDFRRTIGYIAKYSPSSRNLFVLHCINKYCGLSLKNK